jgi:crotonobetainyl-CoA:carnitine CoA-transferase CaiB-like acyl-CoA transferase
MPEPLLSGLHVLDLAGDPAAMAGRILAELGAEVVRVAPPLADPMAELAWAARSRRAGAEELDALWSWADVVIATPGWPGTVAAEPTAAPQAVWVLVTPFGGDGPRAHWRASDLGVMAASGNMYCTGDPDRPPVRCTMPASYCHTGPEVAFAALTGVASGRPQTIDLSMQECVSIASMGAAGRYFRTPFRGTRTGAVTGRTREIWRCADGWVSFGLRGGKARVPSLRTISALVGDPVLTGRDWDAYDHNTATDAELRAIEKPIAEWFASRTMAELYAIACETNLMLAPANSPRELFASEQLAARGFFGPFGDIRRFPLSFVKVRHPEPVPAPAARGEPAAPPTGAPAWAGTRIVEFGAGAAGPIATRYFAEHGAEVIKVESRARPDFLRTYATAGLDASEMFDALNVGKRSVTLNLKHPEGVALARRLIVEWAEAVAENFAPRAMRGFGLHYDALAGDRPDLVMISACLMGQTGPHRDYPGFGGQGSALSGFNWLTGWPDREPLGPYGTITDSLAPRFVAAALAAGLLYRRRTGRGVYFDLSQVEAAAWSLSPWLLAYEVEGRVVGRMGNDDPTGRARVHGVFPCAGDDRWVAIAAWTDAEAQRLRAIAGDDLPAWTGARSAVEVAETLQAAGIEAVPVQDFADCFADPQYAHRRHFEALTHPVLGEGRYERNGFRLSDAPSGYGRASPTLGQHTAEVLGEILGIGAAEQRRLADEGVLA